MNPAQSVGKQSAPSRTASYPPRQDLIAITHNMLNNAAQPVKAAADFITDTNNNDGVAKAIRYFCFEN